MESEVNNGGSSQYFVNGSAESAHFIADALKMIGAPKTADICQPAIAAALPAGLPESAEAIRSAAADFSDEVLERLESLVRPRILFLPPKISRICLSPTSQRIRRTLARCRSGMTLGSRQELEIARKSDDLGSLASKTSGEA